MAWLALRSDRQIFNVADPDPTFHLDADPDSAFHRSEAVLRIRDVYPGSRILIFTHPGSQIQKQQKKRGVKKNLGHTIFCSHKFHKIENYFNLDPGSRGQKGSRSRNWIRNTGAKSTGIKRSGIFVPISKLCRNLSSRCSQRFFLRKKIPNKSLKISFSITFFSPFAKLKTFFKSTQNSASFDTLCGLFYRNSYNSYKGG